MWLTTALCCRACLQNLSWRAETLYLLNSNYPFSPLPQPLVTTTLLCLYEFDSFRCFITCSLAGFVLLWVASFPQHSVLQAHPYWCTWQGFLLWKGWLIFLTFLWWVYHSFLYPFIFQWTSRLQKSWLSFWHILIEKFLTHCLIFPSFIACYIEYLIFSIFPTWDNCKQLHESQLQSNMRKNMFDYRIWGRNKVKYGTKN